MMPMHDRGLKMIALYEASKGALAVAVALAFLTLTDGRLHAFSESALRRLHLDPSTLDFDGRLVMCGAIAYAAMHFTVAVGLWKRRAWAEWLAMLSIATYIPFEFYEMAIRLTAVKVAITAVNLVVFAVVFRTFRRQRALAQRGKTGHA